MSGRKFKLYRGMDESEESDDHLFISGKTATDTLRKRGRPRKVPTPKMKFPRTTKR